MKFQPTFDFFLKFIEIKKVFATLYIFFVSKKPIQKKKKKKNTAGLKGTLF
jgi:hypothetical protein